MRSKEWKKFDWILVLAFVALCVIGCLEIFTSTQVAGHSPFLIKQLGRLLLGFGLFTVIMLIDYRLFMGNMAFFYGTSLLILIGVLFFGVEVRHAKSWVNLGGILFQPSELVKIVVVLTAAKYLADIHDHILSLKQIATAAGIVILPILLVILQHDLGSALPLIPVLAIMLIVAGLRKGFVIVAVLTITLGLGCSWFILQGYQKERILVVFNPDRDPKGSGYQTKQSTIAIGSGGFLGRGLGEGSQGAMGFLPEKHTDFIFALVGEELGLLGTSLTLLLYAAIFYRGLKIAYYATDKAAMYACIGLVSLLAAHLAINIGMALGLLPVIGIPLPPLSYGGSSAVSSCVLLGLLVNFRIHQSFV